ncbi:MAG: DUF1553 domain-containing protein [Planctomycetaceae bacterium]
MSSAWRALSIACAAAWLPASGRAADAAAPAIPVLLDMTDWSAADREIASDGPLALWRFEEASGDRTVIAAVFESSATADTDEAIPTKGVACRIEGAPVLGEPGPKPPRHPDCRPDNRAALYGGGRGFLSLGPAPDFEFSRFRFGVGDSITLEAWVHPFDVPEGRQVYIIGKGRTGRPGQATDNQNWALRLTGSKGLALPSFLFRGATGAFHRWTAAEGIEPSSGWHHVAVSYTFGRQDSLIAFVDGRQISGSWDLGGASDAAPVQDDDEVWVGSSLGGGEASTFPGMLDSVAVHRRIIPPARIAARHHLDGSVPISTEETLVDVPEGRVLFEVIERVPDGNGFAFTPREPTENFTGDVFALPRLPLRYDEQGLRNDRTNPFIVRARCRFVMPPGPQQLTIRTRGAARIHVDGTILAELPPPSQRTDGHENMFEPDRSGPAGIRFVQVGDQARVLTLAGDGGMHELRVDVRVGGKGRRPETGEFSASLGAPETVPRLITTTGPAAPLTDAGWAAVTDAIELDFTQRDTLARRKAAASQDADWQRRHERARRFIASLPPLEPPTPPESDRSVTSPVDRFWIAGLLADGKQPPETIDDAAFIRRLSLDVRGVIPTSSEVVTFLGDRRSDRRQRLVDTFLADPRWADHWVGYWQDVLAENPNLVNPTLNNTGPFRFWIHEAFLDRKTMDRFVTELVRMQGSTHFGGPGGFALATENDVPMAAKAHVLSRAFMAMEMNCARCHDAPSHPFLQQDLFGLAAMLGREPQTVPPSSSVPGGPNRLSSLSITVSLAPGTSVSPSWPFETIVPRDVSLTDVRAADDTRDVVAALFTAPENRRFPQVIVNRLWQRYFGVGIVPNLDDWESATPSDPDLLEWLARQLVAHDYSIGHVARLILTSEAYAAERSPRRMSAEQLADSVLVACGKSYDVEPMNIDVDTSRPTTLSLNLGTPARAWQFAALGNERDRPSLSLPFAQNVVTMMEAFGWRGERQNPVSVREAESTPLQPAILANGAFLKRACQLSDDGGFTILVTDGRPLVEVVDELFLRILSRLPNAHERKLAMELLAAGYADRVVQGASPAMSPERPVGVTWSNHLSDEANQAKIALARIAAMGDPPTNRLDPDWRERAEDLIWTLYNLPEFIFVP